MNGATEPIATAAARPALRAWRLALPMPPSTNRYWRSIVVPGQKHAQHYVGDEGKAYRKLLCELAMLHRWPRGLTGRLSLHMIVFPPNRRVIDIDNRVKILLDALGTPTRPKESKAAVFVDDAQIDDLRVQRGPIVPQGLVHAVLAELPADGCGLATGAWPAAAQPLQVPLLARPAAPSLPPQEIKPLEQMKLVETE